MSKNETKEYDIFFSYSRKDGAAAKRIVQAIKSLGYKVFYDLNELEGTNDWETQLIQSLKNAHSVVFFRTHNSVRSKNCRTEIKIADSDPDISLIPIVFESQKNCIPDDPGVTMTLTPYQNTFISDSLSLEALKEDLRTALANTLKKRGKEYDAVLGDLISNAALLYNNSHKGFFDQIMSDGVVPGDSMFSLRWRIVVEGDIADFCISVNTAHRPYCKKNHSCDNEIKKCEITSDPQKGSICPKGFNIDSDEKIWIIEKYIHFIDSRKINTDHETTRQKEIRQQKTQLYSFLCRILEDVHVNMYGNREYQYIQREKIEETNDYSIVKILLKEGEAFFNTMISAVQDHLKKQFIFNSYLDKEKKKRFHEMLVTQLNDHFKTGIKSSDVGQEGKLIRFDVRENRGDSLLLSLKDSSEKELFLLSLNNLFIEKRTNRYFLSVSHEFSCQSPLESVKNIEEKEIFLPGTGEGEQRESLLEDHLNRIASEIKNRSYLTSGISTKFGGEFLDAIIVFCEDKSDKDMQTIRWNLLVKNEKIIIEAYFQPSSLFDDEEYDLFMKERLRELVFCLEISWENSDSFSTRKEIRYPFFESVSKLFPHEYFSKKTYKKSDLQSCLQEFENEIKKNRDSNKDKLSFLQDLWVKSAGWVQNYNGTILSVDQHAKLYGGVFQEKLSKNPESIWPLLLSSNVRFCRFPNEWKEIDNQSYKFALSIRSGEPGLEKITLGWLGGDSFKKLNLLEKQLFWSYVLMTFPEDMKDLFMIHKNGNAIYLKNGKDAKIFDKVNIFDQLAILMERKSPNEKSLLDKMFEAVNNASQRFLEADEYRKVQ